jgi:membrane-associated phospholipid phosphatase
LTWFRGTFTHTLSHSPFEANTTCDAMPNARPTYWRFLLPSVLLLAAVAAFGVDLPVVRQLKHWTDRASPDFSRNIAANLGYFDMFELFGHGLGVLVALLMLHQLDPARRWAMPRVALCALAAGGAADLVKLLISRTRPYGLSSAFSGSVWATFEQWFPPICNQSGLQGFPSAHTATAAGLAAALIWLYPQGRFLFTLLVILVGCQRIVSRAHFPSDVLSGAAIGCLVSIFFLYVGRLPVWFNRWESRWRGK